MIRLALVLLTLTQAVYAISGDSTVCSDATGKFKYNLAYRISGIAPSHALGQYDETLNIEGKEYILSKFLVPKEEFVTNLNVEWTETGLTLGVPVTTDTGNGTKTVSQTLKRLNVRNKETFEVLYSGHCICEVTTRKLKHLPPSTRPI